MICIIYCMVSKLFRDVWHGLKKYWIIIFGVLALFGMQFGISLLSVLLFDDPNILCGGLALLLAVGLLFFGIIRAVRSRLDEARRYCKREKEDRDNV